MGVAYDLVTATDLRPHPFAGGTAAAVAIVVFTACVRLALLPLEPPPGQAGKCPARGSNQGQETARTPPEGPVRAQQEITALYRAEGTSDVGRDRPALLQLPVFAVVYRMFLSPSVGGHANLLLAHTLLGDPLGGGGCSPPEPSARTALVFLGLSPYSRRWSPGGPPAPCSHQSPPPAPWAG